MSGNPCPVQMQFQALHFMFDITTPEIETLRLFSKRKVVKWKPNQNNHMELAHIFPPG